MNDLLGLDALVSWLECGKKSGYRAARQSQEQEEHWARLLRELIAREEEYDDRDRARKSK